MDSLLSDKVVKLQLAQLAINLYFQVPYDIATPSIMSLNSCGLLKCITSYIFFLLNQQQV